MKIAFVLLISLALGLFFITGEQKKPVSAGVVLVTPAHQAKANIKPSVGEFTKIYDPSVGEDTTWYINDHCFVYGPDEQWHMFGITHEEPANPLDEKHFAHATADSLTQQYWVKQPFALSVDSTQQEEHLWAPYVFLHEGVYYMYYCAGDKDHARYRIHLATSTDLWHWERHPDNPLFQDGYDARDPFIIRIGEQWVMYYTANDNPQGGHHIVAYRTSNDLLHWSERAIAYQDTASGTYGGPCESPFVQKFDDKYYLFLSLRGEYARTEALISNDPFQWDVEDKVLTYNAHASEVVQSRAGEWYVSHCGWGQGGLYLAPLSWGVN